MRRLVHYFIDEKFNAGDLADSEHNLMALFISCIARQDPHYSSCLRHEHELKRFTKKKLAKCLAENHVLSETFLPLSSLLLKKEINRQDQVVFVKTLILSFIKFRILLQLVKGKQL